MMYECYEPDNSFMLQPFCTTPELPLLRDITQDSRMMNAREAILLSVETLKGFHVLIQWTLIRPLCWVVAPWWDLYPWWNHSCWSRTKESQVPSLGTPDTSSPWEATRASPSPAAISQELPRDGQEGGLWDEREIQPNVTIQDSQAASWESLPCPFLVVYVKHFCAQWIEMNYLQMPSWWVHSLCPWHCPVWDLHQGRVTD